MELEMFLYAGLTMTALLIVVCVILWIPIWIIYLSVGKPSQEVRNTGTKCLAVGILVAIIIVIALVLIFGPAYSSNP
ncbi:MAG: hypothetical protein JWL77_6287 [Chthonomonadaceae bacterium]|nr:hypothetical protein [Chthonomonadaceae bacterium]